MASLFFAISAGSSDTDFGECVFDETRGFLFPCASIGIREGYCTELKEVTSIASQSWFVTNNVDRRGGGGGGGGNFSVLGETTGLLGKKTKLRVRFPLCLLGGVLLAGGARGATA